MIAVLDGDVFAYQASAMGAGTADPIQMTDDVTVENGNTGTALQIIKQKIEQVMQLPGINGIIVALSDHTGANFRKDVNPAYKRERGEKPEDFPKMIKYLRDNYVCHEFPGLEGDDVMGLLLTGSKAQSYIGFTTDKDLYTIPGNVVRINHDWTPNKKPVIYRPRKITVREADHFWMTQVITGDTVDGYKGAPGAGPKRAEKALNPKLMVTTRTMWDAVLHVYADQFDHKRWGKEFTQPRAYDEALMNARCARILRNGDYDHKTGEVKLWTP